MKRSPIEQVRHVLHTARAPGRNVAVFHFRRCRVVAPIRDRPPERRRVKVLGRATAAIAGAAAGKHAGGRGAVGNVPAEGLGK